MANLIRLRNHLYVWIFSKAGFNGPLISKELLWYEKIDSLRNSKVAALFCS